MKKVFSSNSQCIHTFAQQSQQSGNTPSRSVFFENTRTLYSYGYHFPLAHFIDSIAVILNSDSYSVSTSKQQGITRQAVNHYNKYEAPTFIMKDLANGNSINLENAKKWVELTIKEVEALCIKSKRRRSEYHAKHDINVALSLLNNTDKVLVMLRHSKLVAPLRAAYEAIAGCDVEAFTAQAAKREAARQAKIERELKDKIKKWLAGENVSISSSKTAYMRLKNTETIQTSFGAEFPINEGLKAFDIIKKVKASNKTVEFERGKITLGYYSIDRITASGDVKAGCHFVKYPQIEFVAKQLGV